ncbi:MAG: hypothetical protein PHI73_05255 [Patescibacteria group bacterium]|nr:hypothetical protein [Patescibacteria group bacterium]
MRKTLVLLLTLAVMAFCIAPAMAQITPSAVTPASAPTDTVVVIDNPNFKVSYIGGGMYLFTAHVQFPTQVQWDDGPGTGPYTVSLSGDNCLMGDPELVNVPDSASEVTYAIGSCDKNLTLYLHCRGANGKTGWPWCYGGYKVRLPADGKATTWQDPPK